MLSRIPLITGLVASLALFDQAQASNRDAAIAGAVVGAVIGGVIISQSRPVQVYTPPPPAYYPPPPVAYYPPQPVHYPPQAIYYQPAPVYYVQERPRHKRWYGQEHRRHDGRGHRHGYRW
ncbi:MAG: hypothetical protein Q7J43_13320 [Pseudomonas sp.]|uniref:hypothetical protein n=1 Tax=Pseudomonas sp. TaxID=306 RepID=UPI0027242618|nr:hypothetical protein [Pseudomonas sp.]MDO9618647.1 hypothetical protein [Pseudomonas sp.]MDP2447516.1 hypothetical protein [Pseudomonas sp.]MDZ4337996.1 hypothetical protein [Pseudomonas sp.]